MTSNTPVTVIGLGSMGSVHAETLLKAGHPTTVWNRTAAKADDVIAQGATRAETIADAVAASDLLIGVVLGYEVLHKVLAPAEGSLSGKTLINLTNGTPAQARET